MKKIAVVFFLLGFTNQVARTQDWQCIRDSTITFFQDSAKTRTWAVRIDSVADTLGYRYYYGFNRLRTVSSFMAGNSTTYCFDPRGASRIGKCMSAGPAGNFFFNSADDGIRFITDTHPGDSWICCRITDTTRLYVTVTSEMIDTILGEADSVKYMTFLARHINGDTAIHPLNGKPFILSKHFGMILLYDFYAFPNLQIFYTLAGITNHYTTSGVQNLTRRQVFSYAPGDVFHTFYQSITMNGDPRETRTVKTILDSTWNSEGTQVTYHVARFEQDRWSDYDPTHYRRDTISETFKVNDGNCEGLNKLPEETYCCYSDTGTLVYASLAYQYPGKNGKYNSRMVKETNSPSYLDLWGCGDSLVSRSYYSYWSEKWSYYSIEGCGDGFWEYEGHEDYHHWYGFYSLVYFSKGQETWGVPFDTTQWHDPIPDPDTNAIAEYVTGIDHLQIYPNPASEQITVELMDEGVKEYKLEIFNQLFQKVDEFEICQPKTIISTKKWLPGIYILSFINKNQQVGYKKIVKY
jgi:hypothetical protein